LSDLSVFIDDKNLIIDDWLLIMRNKLKENANWFLIAFSKKHTYESKSVKMRWSI
jgi:hypothetical protein